MLVVGLTGNIASGKSAVAAQLAARGIPVIDADALAREATAPGSPALAAILARWGARVRAADGSLDRGALREIVFASGADRTALEAIVHPVVDARRKSLLAAARERGTPVLVCDIPLLFEAGLADQVDVVLLVDAPREVRLERLMRERGLTRAVALEMMDAQLPADQKRKQADYMIENDGTRDELSARVDAAWRSIEHDHLATGGR